MSRDKSRYQRSPILSQAMLTFKKGFRASHAGYGWTHLMAGLLVSFAIAFNLYHLLPEVTVQSPHLNDGVLHLLALEGMASALAEGKDPSDFWLSMISLGYPLFHQYQHLAYLPLVVLHWLSGGALQLSVLFSWTQYLLLSLFPLSIYWSMRRFGFNCCSAALAGLVAPLLATNHLYGFDFASYVWRGSGLYTQLWGMFLLPPALAQGHFVLRSGRGYLMALLLLAATLLVHLVLGYIALVSLAVLVLISPRGPAALGAAQTTSSSDRLTRALRLGLLVLLLVLVAAYFLLPFWLDSAYMNRSVWEKEEKYDSYGYEWVLGALVRGDLLDFGRFPWLTILAALGLLRCMWHWRDERYRVPAALFITWLLLYFGRPTWGVLLDLLPISRDLHFHRLIAGVHLGAIFLAGLGLAWLWEWAAARKKITYVLAVAALTFVILYPCYAERSEYLAQNAQWLLENHNATVAEERDTAALIATLKSLPPGRVYAGLGNNWGREYRIGFVPMYALLNSAGLDMVGYLYHALSLNADILVHFDESRPEHYNLFNVRYVVAPAERAFPDFVRPLGDFGRHRLYQVETTGYFDVVSTSVAFTGIRDDWYTAASAWLNSPLLRDKEHPALLFRPVPWLDLSRLPLSQAVNILAQFSSLPGSPPLGQVRSEAVEDNVYSAEVELEHPGMVLLKVTYHPNWHATLDGVETATVMLMPSYVGVPVPSGVHKVHLEYRSGQLRRYLMLVGMLTVFVVALSAKKRVSIVRLTAPLAMRARSIVAQLRSRASALATCRPCLTMKVHVRQHLPYLSTLALMTLLAGLPLFQFKTMSGHDALEYLPRQVEFYEGLMTGQLFPRWAPDLSGGYGQPFFVFNPPVIYYMTALFRVMGFSFIGAQSMALFALLLLSGLGMYVLASSFLGRYGGLVAAAAYLFAPYLLICLYVRHALADFSAFAFIPWAIWGLYDYMVAGRPCHLVVGAFAIMLVLLSSNPVALTVVPVLGFLIAFSVLHGQGAERSVILMRGLWCLGLGMALGAFFWVPALLERNLVHTGRLLTGYLNYKNHFVHLFQFFYSPWGFGLSLPGAEDAMSFAIGPVHLILCGASIWLLLCGRNIRVPAVQTWFWVGVLGLAVFFASNASQFVWDHLPLLQYLQFPWRFMSLAAVSSAFLCGVPFWYIDAEKSSLARWLMVGLVVAIFVWGFPRARPEKFLDVSDADFSPYAIAQRNVSVTTANEYEPIWVQQRPHMPVTEPLTLLEGQGEITVLRYWPSSREFRVVITETARIRLNTFYFPGWTLEVDGQERPIEYDNVHGIMEITLESGDHHVRLQFLTTPLRRVSAWASFLALVVLMLTPWKGKLLAALRHVGMAPG